jgi:uncharacterized protein (TIGR02145 family)
MSGTRVVVEKPMPVLTLSSGTATQTVDQNKPIADIIYTAASATIALSSSTAGLPAGGSGTLSGTPSSGSTFTISGTPTAAGTFNYTVTATHTDGGCTNTLSGAIMVRPGTPPYAASTQTWTVSGIAGAQTWSDVINIPACNKGTYSATNATADCRNNGTYGYLYSWVYVANNASTLCPSPWRVPISTDFCTLEKILNNRSTCNNARETNRGQPYFDVWGGELGAICDANGNKAWDGYGGYWSSTSFSSTTACGFWFYLPGVWPCEEDTKELGMAVRCVK